MKRIATGVLGIADGALQLFSDFETGGPMWTQEGPREVRRSVRFDEPFAASPTVTVGLRMWDIHGGSNQRAEVLAENVTPEGMEIVFRTWGDTRVARVSAGWVAFGPLPDPDSWDV